MTAAEIIREARELYKENPGHPPVSQMAPYPEHCMVTALAKARPLLGWENLLPLEDYEVVMHEYSKAWDAVRTEVAPLNMVEFVARKTTYAVLEAFDNAARAVDNA